MDLFIVIFQSVLAIIGIGVLGFWILKRGIIPENVISVLSRLAIEIALPSVVFSSIFINFEPQKMPDWWKLPMWWILFFSIVLILSILGTFLSRTSFPAEFSMSLFYQNGLFFPIIVITGLFGANSPYIASLFIFIILHPTLVFSTNHLFFRKKTGIDKTHALNIKRIINPVLIVTIVAMSIILVGVKEHIPLFIVNMFDILGDMTFPLIMLILGGSLYIDFQNKGKIYFSEVLRFVVIKNFIFPILFIPLLTWIRPDYHIALIIFLQSAVPPITGVPIWVKSQGGNASLANQFILGSFVISIVSIPVMFMVFNIFFPMP